MASAAVRVPVIQKKHLALKAKSALCLTYNECNKTNLMFSKHYLTSMLMESRVKFRGPQNILLYCAAAITVPTKVDEDLF